MNLVCSTPCDARTHPDTLSPVLGPDAGDDRDDVEPENEGSLSHSADLLNGTPSEWGPPGPDGAPMMQHAPPPDAAPDFAPETSPCMRGPCKHLHLVYSHFEHGNVSMGGYQPRQRRISCMRQPGVWLEMSGDAPVLECNQWDPAPAESPYNELLQRRQMYYSRHPEHDPSFIASELEQELLNAEKCDAGNGRSDSRD